MKAILAVLVAVGAVGCGTDGVHDMGSCDHASWCPPGTTSPTCVYESCESACEREHPQGAETCSVDTHSDHGVSQVCFPFVADDGTRGCCQAPTDADDPAAPAKVVRFYECSEQ